MSSSRRSPNKPTRLRCCVDSRSSPPRSSEVCPPISPSIAYPTSSNSRAIVNTDEAVSIGFVPPTYAAGRAEDGYPVANVDVIREHVAVVMELPAAEAIAVLGLEPLADACG